MSKKRIQPTPVAKRPALPPTVPDGLVVRTGTAPDDFIPRLVHRFAFHVLFPGSGGAAGVDDSAHPGRTSPYVESPCWIWTGATTNGHGNFEIGVDAVELGLTPRRNILARRFSYLAWVGPIPETYMVGSACRVPLCVNPAHLYLAHRNAEKRAALRELRQAAQTPLPQIVSRVGARPTTTSRLSEVEIQEIRQRADAGESYVDLAPQYGISRGHCLALVMGHFWVGTGDVRKPAGRPPVRDRTSATLFRRFFPKS